MLNRISAVQVCDARNGDENYKSWLHYFLQILFILKILVLDIKPEMHYITILHHIFLPFNS
jgi:hypothetical protein